MQQLSNAIGLKMVLKWFKWFKNAIENMIHVFCAKKKRFLKLLLNRLYFAKNLSWVMILVSIAFQRYIASTIWAMLREVQPSSQRRSGALLRQFRL